MESIIQSLVELDHKLFFFLNGAHNPVLDFVMKWLSNIYVWIPLYAILTAGLFYRFSRKKAWMALAAVLLVFVITDLVSAAVIKETVQRLRPSHRPEWEGMFRLLESKGGLYSFVSSHAANVFGLACISSLIYRKKRYTVAIYLWAAAVSYSRIYVGKHFPLDILFGTLLGLLAGWFVFWLYKKVLRKTDVPCAA
ncbi:MAG TPA: phosphatase PAP2 family protein [Bacteroidales bacterium]|jgi:undecaprenyl-diphosphatase|nr:phosphatase PAP2 family protein [Bacteroidales bacterium]